MDRDSSTQGKGLSEEEQDAWSLSKGDQGSDNRVKEVHSGVGVQQVEKKTGPDIPLVLEVTIKGAVNQAAPFSIR